MKNTDLLPMLPDRDTLRSKSWARAAFSLALLRAGGIPDKSAVAFAADRWPHDPRVERLVRAATSPMDSSDAAGIVASGWGDFIGSLAPIAASAPLIAAAPRLNSSGREDTISAPWVADLSGAGFVAEDEATPVLAGVTTSIGVATATKIAFIVTLSKSSTKVEQWRGLVWGCDAPFGRPSARLRDIRVRCGSYGRVARRSALRGFCHQWGLDARRQSDGVG